MSTRAAAQQTGGIEPLAGVASSRGFALSLTTGLSVPPEGGKLGAQVAGDVRYGVALGRIVVALGARLEASHAPRMSLVGALGTARVSVPFAIVAGYLFGAAGYAWGIDPTKEAVMLEAGAGLTVPLTPSIALGAEASYTQLLEQDFRSLFLGPTLIYRP